MNSLIRKKKHFYDQTRLHETNYALFSTLLGDLDKLDNGYQLPLGEGSELRIHLLERHRYTLMISLQLTLPHLKPFNNDLSLEIRLYLDAGVAEVSHYQGHGRFAASCETPNQKGYHADEKQQANRMLQEALRYCIKQQRQN